MMRQAAPRKVDASEVLSASPLYTPLRQRATTFILPSNDKDAASKNHAAFLARRRADDRDGQDRQQARETTAAAHRHSAGGTTFLQGTRVINEAALDPAAERQRAAGIIGIPMQDHRALLAVLEHKCGPIERYYPHGEDSSSLYVVFRREESVARADLLQHVLPVRGQYFGVESHPAPYPTEREVQQWKSLRARTVVGQSFADPRLPQQPPPPVADPTANNSSLLPSAAAVQSSINRRPLVSARSPVSSDFIKKSRFLALEQIPLVGDVLVPILSWLIPAERATDGNSTPENSAAELSRKRQRE